MKELKITDAESSNTICQKCGEDLQTTNVDYFGKFGIITLAIAGLLITTGFYYVVITHSNGGNYGKFLVAGTLGIFTLIFKISNLKQKTTSCLNCKTFNTTD